MKFVARRTIRTDIHDYEISAFSRSGKAGFFAFYLRTLTQSSRDNLRAPLPGARADQVEGTVSAASMAELSAKCRALIEAASGPIIADDESVERA